MRLTRCRLTEKQQNRWFEFFVAEEMVLTAADFAGMTIDGTG